jgi:hypothetical protein
MQPHLSGESFLLNVARIALTFIGFASVISLMHHRRTEWLEQEIQGLKLMIEFDLAATLFALLPFPVLFTLGEEREWLVWRISCSLLACYLVIAFWRHYRRYARGIPQPRHPLLFLWTFTAPMVLMILLESVSAVFNPSLAAYSWGLYLLMMLPIVQFCIFMGHFGDPAK